MLEESEKITIGKYSCGLQRRSDANGKLLLKGFSKSIDINDRMTLRRYYS